MTQIAVSPRRAPLARVVAALLAAVVLIAGFAPAPARADATDVIAAGVTVDGVAVAGMTRDEAIAVLTPLLAHYADGQVTVSVDTWTAGFPLSAVGRHADVATLADVAIAIGRSVDLLPAELRALIRPDGLTIDPLVVFDAASLATAVAGAASQVGIAPVNGTARVTATGFARTAAKNGRGMPQADVVAALAPLLANPATASPVELSVASVVLTPAVTDAAVAAAIAAARKMVRPVDIIRGTGSWRISATTVRSWLRFALPAGGGYRASVNLAATLPALRKVRSASSIAPRNARILSARGGRRLTGVTIRPSHLGRRLDLTATRSLVASAVNARGTAPSTTAAIKVKGVFTILKPAVDATQAAKLVSRLRRLGRGWTTYYQVGQHNGFGANITIPARTLNGQILGPGESFSFWGALGEVSFRKGYRLGGAIIGGRTNEQGALAGGICSASTTLFNAAVRAGLDILERHNHYYYITRYPRGLDATVSKTNNAIGQNMRFRNDTSHPLLVRGFAGPGWVTFEVWGIPDGRTTSFTAPAITGYQRATDTVQYTSTLPKGVRKRIEYPVDGFHSVVVRTVRSAAGKVLFRDTFTSGYHVITGIVLVGR